VGIVSTLSFAYAVARLGPDRAAIAGALTPVAASLLAVPLLGELPPLSSLLGMTVIVAGVLLANRPTHPRSPPLDPPPTPPGPTR
jgi:drug/metabolite transporter (DMT)-like permease